MITFFWAVNVGVIQSDRLGIHIGEYNDVVRLHWMKHIMNTASNDNVLAVADRADEKEPCTSQAHCICIVKSTLKFKISLRPSLIPHMMQFNIYFTKYDG